MTNIETPVPAAVTRGPLAMRYIEWSAVMAGALVAAALALVLHAFAAAIGLGVSSTAPTWRDASVGLILLSALYLFLVAFISYGAGGYLVGRLRTRFSPTAVDDVEYGDGVHGILVWAIATLLTGLLALGAAQALTLLTAPPASEIGPGTSVA